MKGAMKGAMNSVKDVGTKTGEGFKAIGSEISGAIKTSYIKQAPHEVSKSFSELKEQLSDGMNKQEFSDTWNKFSSNLKEVFGNAKTNISNKKFTGIFSPPNTETTEPNEKIEPENLEEPSVKPSFLKSEVYNVSENEASLRSFRNN